MCGTARPFSIQNNLTTILPVGDGIIVSTRTGIVLSGADPVLPSVVTSGYKLTNYLLNPDENTVDISTFTAPLVSSESVHALHYFSVDNALNYEFARGATIYAAGKHVCRARRGER